MNGILSPTTVPHHVERLAMVARWKPVHLGHAAVLEALVARADIVTVGIGSSNKYNASNPFTAAETVAMLRLVLGPNSRATIVGIPDFGHGPRWRAMVREVLGPRDLFVTANPYVRDLMSEIYPVAHPAWLVPAERHVAIDGAMVRTAMAEGADWRSLVPASIAEYLDERDLARRVVEEFGADILALKSPRTSR